MTQTQPLTLTLDGHTVEAKPGETLWQLAARYGIEVPHLCHASPLQPAGNCRACVVEVDGERTLAASCCRQAEPGMVVQTQSPRAQQSQRMVLELLLADMPGDTPQSLLGQPLGELGQWAQRLDVQPRAAFALAARPAPAPDTSHPALRVQLDACIQCTRCVRACRDEQGNDVLGMVWRGAHAHIAFDLDDPAAASQCVACGECVQACPTGAIASAKPLPAAPREVPSVCPYCGVGCQLTYQVQPASGAQAERIVGVLGRDGPANGSRLCVKGRYGYDYIEHPERLQRPLRRRPDAPKNPNHCQQPPHWSEVFEEVDWEQALQAAVQPLQAIRAAHGGGALAGLGCAKGSNEEAYVFQKLVRTVFASPHVDHCTRLCHASSVAALLEGLGSGAVSNPVSDVQHADTIWIMGANPTANHPVAASHIKNAVARGARLVLLDPRATELARHAWQHVAFRPGADVAVLHAMLHVVLHELGVANDFAARRVDNLHEVAEAVRDSTPEAMATLCGVSPQQLREVATAYAQSSAAMIFWGMGVSQHTHGTDNVRCLIALACATGQMGRPGTGLHPLRGQNNVQGASDAGLIPMMFPGYQRVDDADANAWFSAFWGAPVPATPGLTVVEMLHQAQRPGNDPERLRGMLIMGENPAMSDPDLHHARAGLASLQHLVVQDLFLTETAWLADVVLPASAWPEKIGTVTNTDRLVQLGAQAVPPPGEARADLWILQQIAERMGMPNGQPVPWLYDKPGVAYHGVAAIYEEMRQAMAASHGGISWQHLQQHGSAVYPWPEGASQGQAVVFTHTFPTANGRAQLVPTQWRAPAEVPDTDYPLVLITGRQLEHWHTGSMTRRSHVLDAIEPEATASVNANTLQAHGLAPGDWMQLTTRRGSVQLRARLDPGTPDGAVFVPFAYAEAAANLLTHAALDPFGKIPEFKYCAVRLRAAQVEPSTTQA